MTTLNPFEMIKTVCDDRSLSVAQAHLLTVMVLRTDNASRRVKDSQENLAKKANMSIRTARRAMEAPEFEKYFNIQRTGRWVNYNWKESVTGHSVTDTGQFVTDTGQSDLPSTLSSTLSSTQEDTLQQEEEGNDFLESEDVAAFGGESENVDSLPLVSNSDSPLAEKDVPLGLGTSPIGTNTYETPKERAERIIEEKRIARLLAKEPELEGAW